MTDQPKPPVSPKTAAILGVIAALFIAAVAFYPPLLPFCQALNFCAKDAPLTTDVQPNQS